jgi:phosphoribosylaminoimidazole-succinocarboxamide synthase
VLFGCSRTTIPTHFVERLSDREMLCKRLTIIPVEVVVRNVVAGSLAKRMGLPEGETLPRPILELYYKRDDLDDPPINDDHALAFDLCTAEELDTIRREAFKVNELLLKFLDPRGIRLVDFKLESGRGSGRWAGQVLLGDEITRRPPPGQGHEREATRTASAGTWEDRGVPPRGGARIWGADPPAAPDARPASERGA